MYPRNDGACQASNSPPVLRAGQLQADCGHHVVGRIEPLEAWLEARENPPPGGMHLQKQNGSFLGVPPHHKPLESKEFPGSPRAAETTPPSLCVRGRPDAVPATGPAPTADDRGLSAAEIERLRIATLYLEELGLPVWVANIGDGLLYRDERSARGVIAQAQSLVAQLQKRAGLPQFAVTILESTFGLHGNIIFVATNKVALQFGRSFLKKYLGEHKGGACRTGFYRVKKTREDWASVRSYYSKERTEEAHAAYGHLSDHYTPGVHRLGQGGGDRVRLSRALDRHLLDLGLVEPYRRTNSRKLTSTTADARPLERVDRREATAPAEHGAIVAPPPAPVDERRDVAGIVAVPAREANDLGSEAVATLAARPGFRLIAATLDLDRLGRSPAHNRAISFPWLALGSPGPKEFIRENAKELFDAFAGDGSERSHHGYERIHDAPVRGNVLQAVRSGRSLAPSPHPLPPAAPSHDRAKCFPLEDLRPSAINLMNASDNKFIMTQQARHKF